MIGWKTVLTQIVFRRHSQARFVDGESVGKSFTAEAVEDDGPNFSGAFLWSPKAFFFFSGMS